MLLIQKRKTASTQWPLELQRLFKDNWSEKAGENCCWQYKKWETSPGLDVQGKDLLSTKVSFLHLFLFKVKPQLKIRFTALHSRIFPISNSEESSLHAAEKNFLNYTLYYLPDLTAPLLSPQIFLSVILFIYQLGNHQSNTKRARNTNQRKMTT